MTYKRPHFILFFILTLCCCHWQSLRAQEKKVPVAFSFTVPEAEDYIDEEIYKAFVKKAMRMNTVKSGIYRQIPIVIHPKIVVIKDMLAGEIDEVHVVKLQLELKAQHSDGSIVFHHYKEMAIATASTTDQAILKAIDQIKDNDVKLVAFFNETSVKVFDYYQAICSDLVKQSATMIDRKQYSMAWDLLKHIPPSVSCFNEIDKKISSIYLKKKDQHCNKILDLAYKEANSNEDRKALHYLKFIDPNSDCAKDALALTATIIKRAEINAQKDFQTQQLNFQQLTETEKLQQLRADNEIISVLNAF